MIYAVIIEQQQTCETHLFCETCTAGLCRKMTRKHERAKKLQWKLLPSGFDQKVKPYGEAPHLIITSDGIFTQSSGNYRVL